MRQRGFLLIDCMIAIVVMALAVTALMLLLVSGTRANAESTEAIIASRLARNIYELAAQMPIKDSYTVDGTTYSFPYNRPSGSAPTPSSNLLWLNGYAFNPPVDSRGSAIADQSNNTLYAGWAQQCAVTAVDVYNPGATVTASNTNGRQLTVTITHKNQTVFQQTWFFAPVQQ